ncbi:MAG: response regulator [Lentisphaerae bacterium]|nr:response regulator [Lentisphaerota bacterium]
MKPDEVKHKRYILVVDDDHELLKLVALRLCHEGYRVVAVESGESALAHIKIEKPGLVLLDIMMPGMSGVEILKRIKAMDPNVPVCPVCMVTAVYDEDEAKRCFAAGAYEYVTKPIDFEQLRKAVLIKLFPD